MKMSYRGKVWIVGFLSSAALVVGTGYALIHILVQS